MELEKAEIIEIPVENTANFTNKKQTESGIIVLNFILVLLVLAAYIKIGINTDIQKKYNHSKLILI